MSKQNSAPSIGFGKRNFQIMALGLIAIALGYFLMAGGRSDKADFDPSKIFSFVRITLAPIMILAGFATIAWGILAKSKSQKTAAKL